MVRTKVVELDLILLGNSSIFKNTTLACQLFSDFPRESNQTLKLLCEPFFSRIFIKKYEGSISNH